MGDITYPSSGAGGGSGDMAKATYDVNTDGIVDDANPAGTSLAAALSGKLSTSGTAADVNPAGTAIAAALSAKLGATAQAADVNPAGTAISAALSGKLSTSGTAADVNPSGTSIAAALSGKLGTSGTAADVNPSGTSIAAALSGKLGTSGTAADVNPAGTSIAAALSGKLGTSATAADVNPAGTSISAALGGKQATLTASGASKLFGRGSAAGGGAAEEIALGTGLSMSGTTLSASASPDSYLVKTTTYQAVAGDRIAADVTGGGFTITLPATPADGAMVEIVPAKGTFAAANLTIEPGAESIDGGEAGADLVLSGTTGVLLVYRTGYGWQKYVLGATQFDPRSPGEIGAVSQSRVNCTDIVAYPLYLSKGSDAEANAILYVWWANGGGQSAIDVNQTRTRRVDITAISSLGTPSADSVRLGAKIVGGTAQVETATVVGSVTGDGNARCVVTSALAGTVTVDFAVVNGDAATDVGGKLRTALGIAAITNYYTVGGSGADASLTCLTTPGNDATLNISIDNLTCTGLTAAPTSADSVAGTDGTAEVFVKDEAGNETQISPHSSTAPDHLVDSPFDKIGFTNNCYTGLVLYTNEARLAAGRTDAHFWEDFATHNARLDLFGDRALVELDWDATQAEQVAKREAERAAWAERKITWEADPTHAEKPFTEPEPAALQAKACPESITEQLAGKAALLASMVVPENRKSWPNVQLFIQEILTVAPTALAQVELSADPNIAGLRALLYSWRSDVWSDHPLILQGFQVLQAAGILSAEQVTQICAKA